MNHLGASKHMEDVRDLLERCVHFVDEDSDVKSVSELSRKRSTTT